jgi:outer membrane protein assembly factor BamB
MKKISIVAFAALICGTLFCGEAIASSEGKADPDFLVDINNPTKAWNGNTILPDNHKRDSPRVVEINMNGEVVWEYVLPGNLKRYTNPGFDVELLPSGNILLVLPGSGIYEIDRKGEIIWSHRDKKVSHDADRLPNGNTLYVYGKEDTKNDPQVKEVDPSGKLLWSWYAKKEFNKSPYKDIHNQGWTHTNAVTRLENGNTLISPRNFNMLVEVDPQGKVVRTIGEKYLKYQHDPEVLPNGNILVANHDTPHEVLEIDSQTGEIIWRYAIEKKRAWPVRDANRLPNGNTLITGTTVLLEITADKEIVWRLFLRNVNFRSPKDAPALGFYKAQRIWK